MVRSSNDPLDFSSPAPTPRSAPALRHPLGLPAGSVRSLITLMVVGLVWALMLLAKDKPIEVPLYLLYLLFLILGSFFAAHGNSIAGGPSPAASPWHLPRGSIRLLLIAGFVAVIAWRWWTFGTLPEFKVQDPRDQPYLPLWILGGFFAGMLLTRIVGGVLSRSNGLPAWYQDILAWASLLAILGLVVEVLVLLIINPSMDEASQIKLPQWQTFLSAIISLYFGARS